MLVDKLGKYQNNCSESILNSFSGGTVLRRLESNAEVVVDNSSSGEDVVIERKMPMLVPSLMISSTPSSPGSVKIVQSAPSQHNIHHTSNSIPPSTTIIQQSISSPCIRSIGRGRGFIKGPAKQQNIASLRLPRQIPNQKPSNQLPNQCIGRGRASTTQPSVGRGIALFPTSGAGRGALLNNPQLCQSFDEPPEPLAAPVFSDSSAAESEEPFTNYHDYYNRTKKDFVQVCHASDSDEIPSD